MKKADRVLVTGAFDSIHPGHLALFRQAKQYGGRLIVVVARDSTIRRVKRHEPYFNERERLAMVAAQRMVDKAVLGSPSDPYRIVKKIKPDVLCLGYDQRIFVKDLQKFIKKEGLHTRIVRVRARKSRRYKSSRYKRYLWVTLTT